MVCGPPRTSVWHSFISRILNPNIDELSFRTFYFFFLSFFHFHFNRSHFVDKLKHFAIVLCQWFPLLMGLCLSTNVHATKQQHMVNPYERARTHMTKLLLFVPKKINIVWLCCCCWSCCVLLQKRRSRNEKKKNWCWFCCRCCCCLLAACGRGPSKRQLVCLVTIAPLSHWFYNTVSCIIWSSGNHSGTFEFKWIHSIVKNVLKFFVDI